MRLPICIILALFLGLLVFIHSCDQPPRESHQVRGDFTIVFQKENYPNSVAKAVEALARDIKLTVGVQPKIVSESRESEESNIVYIGNSIPQEFQSGLPKLEGTESHYSCVKVRNDKAYFMVDGIDARGLIYGIYTMSEDFLGVPPMHLWAQWQPKSELTVEDGKTVHYPEPKVKWRVWFPNDRDLLVPWQTETYENYDIIMESLLRCKYNAIEGWHAIGRSPDFNPYETGKLYRKARDHGIRITGHHAMPFSSDLRDWRSLRRQYPGLQLPEKVSAYDTAMLSRYWQYSIETSLKNELQPIWNIGFRGAGDRPFWKTFEDAPVSSEERAKLIETRLNEQISLLKKTTGQSAPDMRWTLYHENTHFVTDSLLIPPSDPNLIWVMVNDRRDHYPPKLISQLNGLPENQRYGYYYHFQFTSTGAHFAQAEGPWKMCRNLDYITDQLESKPSFVVFNVGNIREFITEITVGGKVLWKFDLKADEYVENHFNQWFSTEEAQKVSELYIDFLNSYWQHKEPTLPDFKRQFIFQELRYRGAIESILESIRKEEVNENPLYIQYDDTTYYNIDLEYLQQPNQLQAVVQATTSIAEQLAELEEKANELMKNLSHNSFFFDMHLRSQIIYMKYLNEALRELAYAGLSTDKSERLTYLKKSYASYQNLKALYRPFNDHLFPDWYYFSKEDGQDRFNQYQSEGRILREPWILKTNKSYLRTLVGLN